VAGLNTKTRNNMQINISM